MRLFKVVFFDLAGEGESVPSGRAIVFATVEEPLNIREVIKKAAADKIILAAFADAPITLKEEYSAPEGMSMYSVTVGIPPGGVSFCFAASSRDHLREVLAEALKELGNADLSQQVAFGAWVAREIDLDKEGVW